MAESTAPNRHRVSTASECRISRPVAVRHPRSRLVLQAEIIIRPVREADLRRLEWSGLFRQERALLQREYRRAEAGKGEFLVADLRGYPVGQVWIDYTTREKERVALLSSLRVIEPLQCLGIGTRLMQTAEHAVRTAKFTSVELQVRLKNTRARELYERLGYESLGRRRPAHVVMRKEI